MKTWSRLPFAGRKKSRSNTLYYKDYNWKELALSRENLTKFTVKELQKYLKYHQLSIKGVKNDKVLRIMAHINLSSNDPIDKTLQYNSISQNEVEYEDSEDEDGEDDDSEDDDSEDENEIVAAIESESEEEGDADMESQDESEEIPLLLYTLDHE
ncbi:anaphase-promoting complex subunit 15-like [Actinia tenebrosa]|uniref:Anaphase-promoting complex subunit 15-like n=1 Tax=Actinia tenebrosa TaxID=6105 RepID=A0A6P8J6B3_ACTTE|nr:anaphase-promoting complex subunit 15-like [Actinia tenebrosa]